MATERRKLTPKQAAFVREYLIDLNATQAAIRAGFSKATAQQQSTRLLSNVLICQAIEAAQNVRASKVELTADMVLAGLMKEATREDGTETQGAKVRAWELLGKHLGMLSDKSKVEVTGDVSVHLASLLDRYKRLAAESEVPPAHQ